MKLLRSEWLLQRAFLRSGFTTRRQFVRNLLIRGAYRIVPVSIRQRAYRTMIVRHRTITRTQLL
jgi:hypothetical protein